MHNMHRPTRSQRFRKGGQATVEFALTSVFIFFIVLFIWELAMLTYTYNVLTYAAKEGVRYAVVHGSGNSTACSYPCTGGAATSSAAIQSVVTNAAQNTFHNISGMIVTVNYLDGANASPNRVQVVVSYPYQPFAMLGWSPPVVSALAEGRILN